MRTSEQTLAELRRLRELDWSHSAPEHTPQEIELLITEQIEKEEWLREWYEMRMEPPNNE